MKINKSQIARELEVDRRTVDKYINGYTKPETRKCDDCITPFYDTIEELLSDRNQQIFYYRKVLCQYSVPPEYVGKTHIFKDDHIMERAKENLEIIGKVYKL